MLHHSVKCLHTCVLADNGPLFDIAARAKTLGFYVGLSSNGTLIDAGMAARLAGLGLDYLGVSLDGMAATHDRFRRLEGGFARAAAGIRLAREDAPPEALRLLPPPGIWLEQALRDADLRREVRLSFGRSHHDDDEHGGRRLQAWLHLADGSWMVAKVRLTPGGHMPPPPPFVGQLVATLAAVLLVALVTVIAAGQVYGALVMPTAMTVGLLVAVSAGVLAVGLVATALVRRTLLTEPVHRRMLGMMLFAMATGLVSRGLCALAGLPLATLQLVDLIALAAGLTALALFVAPGMRALAAVALAGALVQAVLAAPAMLVAAVVQSSTVLLFARAWRRAATLE